MKLLSHPFLFQLSIALRVRLLIILPLSAEDVFGWNDWNENLQTVPLGAPYNDKQIICKSIFENAKHFANNL